MSSRRSVLALKMQPADVPARATATIDESLAAAWLTHGLEPEMRSRLASLGRLEILPEGSTITREGEPTRDCGVVLRGRVALRMRVPERGMVTILTVEPGDVVGWSALVPPYRATSTAVALESTELALFDGERLRTELTRQPELAAQVYPMLLQAVSRRLEGTRLQLLDLFTQRWVEPW
jgi:CRP/FNR family transcriptional regulator, cyclic AMP receptor protein